MKEMNARVEEALRQMQEKRRDWFSLITDQYDVRQFRDMLVASDTLKELTSRAVAIGGTGGPLMQDLFDALFKPAPQTNRGLAEDFKVNGQVIDNLLRTMEYKQLHSMTALDDFGSAMGMITIGDQVVDIYVEYKRQMDEIEKQKQGAGADMASDNPATQQKGQEGMAGAQARERRLEQKLRNDLRRASSDAQQGVEEGKNALDMASGWGDGGEGETATTLEEKLALAEALLKNEQFRKIARLLGRLKIISDRVQMSKDDYEVGEIVEITLGNDISRLLPSELMRIKHPLLRKDFKKRYVEGALMQYEVRTIAPKGKGPIVVCEDESGSMCGVRNDWAKAVFMALARLAKVQKRSIALVRFAAGSQIETLVWEDPSLITLPQLVDVATRYYGGGTDFIKPFSEAIDILKQSAFIKGDLIFITDGHCYLPEAHATEYVKLKEELGFRAVGCVVGNGGFDQNTARVLDATVRVGVAGYSVEGIEDLDALEVILAV